MATRKEPAPVFDFVIAGSGFGGSVSAMRLAEKGYSVLVLERGKRYADQDFPKSNWRVWKFLWLPALRCFGIMQISLFRHVIVLHGAGVGGGSLVYANVLMQPGNALFDNPSWKHLADWKTLLRPHYDTARRMLGVVPSPYHWPADHVLQRIAGELHAGATFSPTQVGVCFGEPGQEGQEIPDPYFDGQGPARRACNFCGGCMVGCRLNAKNSLVKNYLYFAEKWGARVWPECEVIDVTPLPTGQADGARYAVGYRRSSAWLFKPEKWVRAHSVVFAAGSLGTLYLLFRLRDVTRTLPEISPRLGSLVRNNSEALLGSASRATWYDFSRGVAITSSINADPVTTVEPVRYPVGSSVMRLLTAPLIETHGGLARRLFSLIGKIAGHPLDFLRTHVLPGWAQRTTILLVMQTIDNHIRVRLGRSLWTLFKRRLVTYREVSDAIPSRIEIGHYVTRRFAQETNGIPLGSLNEGLLDIPMTAHLLGGVPFGRDDQEGVIGLDCQVHNYPGLYVVDGSIMPANPGVNPSLTIAALAEYAMSAIPPKPGAPLRHPLGVA